MGGSNPRPHGCQPCALPAELMPHWWRWRESNSRLSKTPRISVYSLFCLKNSNIGQTQTIRGLTVSFRVSNPVKGLPYLLCANNSNYKRANSFESTAEQFKFD